MQRIYLKRNIYKYKELKMPKATDKQLKKDGLFLKGKKHGSR